MQVSIECPFSFGTIGGEVGRERTGKSLCSVSTWQVALARTESIVLRLEILGETNAHYEPRKRLAQMLTVWRQEP